MTNPKVTFPCEYLIKVIGETHKDFTSQVTAIIKEQTEIVSLKENNSKNKRYLSLSIIIKATDELMIRSLFERLKTLPYVKMIL